MSILLFHHSFGLYQPYRSYPSEKPKPRTKWIIQIGDRYYRRRSLTPVKNKAQQFTYRWYAKLLAYFKFTNAHVVPFNKN